VGRFVEAGVPGKDHLLQQARLPGFIDVNDEPDRHGRGGGKGVGPCVGRGVDPVQRGGADPEPRVLAVCEAVARRRGRHDRRPNHQRLAFVRDFQDALVSRAVRAGRGVGSEVAPTQAQPQRRVLTGSKRQGESVSRKAQPLELVA
jgi:hypothetical protein